MSGWKGVWITGLGLLILIQPANEVAEATGCWIVGGDDFTGALHIL